jgi:sulfoxide reductase catalytic subunit YedY
MQDSGKNTNEPITPPELYFNRRTFIRAGVAAASVIATGALYRTLNPNAAQLSKNAPKLASLQIAGTSQPSAASGFTVDEKMSSEQDITHYNNFYEFSTDKQGVAPAAANFKTDGWQVSVEGLCRKPTVFGLDDLLKIAPLEERVYRMRCVEAWSLVVPWAGYSLSRLLERVEPLSSAKYVAFTTLLDASRMPGQNTDALSWPYIEGLRMDEAMHPLALLTTGLYGKQLPPQDGAPVRLITPWKYGFKGIKSIVKIALVADQPPTSWSNYAPMEYGFYANVNPQVDHPRWSQATEQRIGESGRRPTLMFNGYAEQVASLYTGMDLRKNF